MKETETYTLGFLNLSITVILGWVILCFGMLSCTLNNVQQYLLVSTPIVFLSQPKMFPDIVKRHLAGKIAPCNKHWHKKNKFKFNQGKENPVLKASLGDYYSTFDGLTSPFLWKILNSWW